MKNHTSARGKSKKLAAASAGVTTALITAQAVLPGIVFAANKYEWNRQDDIDTSDGSPTAIAMSASGSHLILGGEGNLGLYISDDSGATWENVADEVEPGVRNWWTSVDVSNDGQTMVAASAEGYDFDAETWLDGSIYISEDAGANWDNITPADTDDWADIAVSGDGSTIVAGKWNSGDVYISENDGASWTTGEAMDNGWSIFDVSISDNGNKILAGGENGNDGYAHLYLSENTGDTWEEVSPNPEDQIYSVSAAISADGNEFAAATTGWSDGSNDTVFVSTNDGADWIDVTPDDGVAANWWGTTLSDDGETIAVLDDNNRKMHVSRNFGATWTEENPSEDYEDESGFAGLDLNTDGSKAFVATRDFAYLGTGQGSENDSDNGTTVSFDNAENGKTITLTTPEGTTITCHSAAKESEMETTDTAYKYPLGLVDFCFSGAETNNEVTLVFVTNLKPADVVVRKYNPDTKEYATVAGAEVTETTLEGKHALQVTYNIVDNGPLDLDPDDGEIADPVGIAVAGSDDGTLADTGNSADTTMLIAIGLLGIGLSLALRQRKQV